MNTYTDFWLLFSFKVTFSSPPENSVPPDVTSSTPQERGSRVDLPPAVRGMSRGQSRSSMLDTADGTLTLKEELMLLHLYFRVFNSSNVGREITVELIIFLKYGCCHLVVDLIQIWEVKPFACSNHSCCVTFSVLH